MNNTLSSAVATDQTFHHGSHLSLLKEPPPGTAPGRIDAVVVPTSRPSRGLTHAIGVAERVNAPVVALCSRLANAAAAADLGRRSGVRVYAVDANRPPESIPAFRTSRLLDGTRFGSTCDLSVKRNIGLLLGRLAGWSAVLFLDDDIEVKRTDGLAVAAGLLQSFDAVGLRNVGFPDNSVVCHARREVGEKQETFIGGGALAVAPNRVTSFFPNIYNEDWLFLADLVQAGRITRVGDVEQQPYDPFGSPRRAKREEFGDSIAEGLYWLFDEGGTTADATFSFWEEFLRRRRSFIRDTRLRAETQIDDIGRRQRMIASLEQSLENCKLITAKRCAEYISAWREDNAEWRRLVENQSTGLAPLDALQKLALPFHDSGPPMVAADPLELSVKAARRLRFAPRLRLSRAARPAPAVHAPSERAFGTPTSSAAPSPVPRG